MTTDPDLEPSSPPVQGWSMAVFLYLLFVLCFLGIIAGRWIYPLYLAEAIDVERGDRAGNVVGDLAGLLDARIDPNTAPWEELARLPGVGENLARRIVAYRESRPAGEPASMPAGPVFSSPDDLRKVPGIGPATVRRLAEHLRFPETDALMPPPETPN